MENSVSALLDLADAYVALGPTVHEALAAILIEGEAFPDGGPFNAHRAAEAWLQKARDFCELVGGRHGFAGYEMALAADSMVGEES